MSDGSTERRGNYSLHPILFWMKHLRGETTLFREYDLRAYGFDMIVDLSWPGWP